MRSHYISLIDFYDVCVACRAGGGRIENFYYQYDEEIPSFLSETAMAAAIVAESVNGYSPSPPPLPPPLPSTTTMFSQTNVSIGLKEAEQDNENYASRRVFHDSPSLSTYQKNFCKGEEYSCETREDDPVYQDFKVSQRLQQPSPTSPIEIQTFDEIKSQKKSETKKNDIDPSVAIAASALLQL